MSDVKSILKEAGGALSSCRLEKAENMYREVLLLDPNNAEAHCGLGALANLSGRPGEALDLLRKAAEESPDDARYLYNYGTMLQRLGKYDQAETMFRKALQIRPNYALAMNNLGAVLNLKGQLTEAIEWFRRAIDSQPSFHAAHSNLGNTLKDGGFLTQAVQAYHEALRIKPDYPVAISNLLLTLNYMQDQSPEELLREHIKWVGELARNTTAAPIGNHTRRPLDRPLRIGYVSADFRTHSVSYFLEPILGHHDRSKFEIFCYSDVLVPDHLTERMRRFVPGWRRIVHHTDEQVVNTIRDDRIDILVDLAGHCGLNRVGVFLRRAAPVQVTYLGYPNTTGIPTMDYRFTDETADPDGYDFHHTETLYRLSGSFLCYRPPDDAPKVVPPPFMGRKHITFGSFNNLSKITDEMIEIWCRILTSVSESRICLKCNPFRDEDIRHNILRKFKRTGIAKDRIQLVGHSSSVKEHLEWYGNIDIALDPYPYSGTTTTCEALWMGVPVISRIGNRHSSRVGLSILRNVGLAGLAAATNEQYIALAAYLAGDVNRLSKLRFSLREAVANSSLCDAYSFTVKLENAYREMWEHHIRANAQLHPTAVNRLRKMG